MDFCIFHKGDWGREIGMDRLGRPKLQELTSYIVESENLKMIPGLLVPISPEGDRAELNFGNYVGIASLFDREIIVESKKISVEQFNQVLSEISEEIANLPFDFNTPVSFAFERSSPQHLDVLYQSFAYLRQIVLHDKPNLSHHFGAIEGNPHRTTLRVQLDKDISLARGVKPSTILGAVARPQFLMKIQEGQRAYGFPCAMKPTYEPDCRYVPTTVQDEHIEVTYDNPENRFVKAFLHQAIVITAHFQRVLDAHLLEKGSVCYCRDIRNEALGVMKTLERMQQAGFLSDVGELIHLPSSSQVLQKAEGYRQVFKHFHKLALSSQYPIDGDSLQRIIEGKDVATLYEYWCFFTMARILRSLLGEPEKAAAGTRGELAVWLSHRISLSFPGSVELQFNRSYPGNSNKSYSVSLRPDISLKAGGRLHLFDAKFKYDRLTFVEEPPADEAELDSDKNEEEVFQRFKHGDLYKMHTYKDAIVDAQDVWILYPGTEFRFYEEGHGRVDTPVGIGELVGVGAIPLKPMGEMRTLKCLLEKAIANGEA